MRPRSLVAAVALVSATFAAHASTITYAVNETAGTYSAQGTVTTDGAVGVLAESDFTAFIFTVSNGSMSDTYSFSSGSMSSGNGSVYLQGLDLTASASSLSFNFGATDGGGIALSDPTTSNFLCFVSSSNVCVSGVNSNVLIDVDANYAGASTADTVQVIGTAIAAPSSVTPEPSSFALLATGLLGVTGMVRKRFA